MKDRLRVLLAVNSDRALSSSRDVCPFEAVLVVLPKLGVDAAVQADLVQGHGGAEQEGGKGRELKQPKLTF